MASLNQIFFGPPGTGKTYATIEAALEILDPAYLKTHAQSREALKNRFDEFAAQGDVRFVTFHQSFSYEDFVEGLRADSDETGQLRYSVVPGVFKTLCLPPSGAYRSFKVGDTYGTGYKIIYVSKDVVTFEKPKGNHLQIGMEMLCFMAEAVLSKQVTVNDFRDQSWDKKLSNSTLDPFIVNGYKNVLPAMVEHMIGGESGGLFDHEHSPKTDTPKVLIIDEINRGNVSRIFGELITLIEPSKRAGADEALEVTLPYSKDRFSVPNNVYLIGTMNTADRSLASMDIALRRRFTFIEVPPNPELLEGVVVEGVAIDELLGVINARIAALLDRDHCLGHAYFMPLKKSPTLPTLAGIFQQQILPLLQEYFFEDWQRIQWVLNDQRKDFDYRFVVQPTQDINHLFGDAVVVAQSNDRWEINTPAFERIESYLGILDHTLKVAAPVQYGAQEVQWQDLTLRQLASGTIEIDRDGQPVKPVLPLLRELAQKHDVPTLWSSGAAYNTRHLGRKVIKLLSEQQG
ncbi:McrB family protein [Pseudomonas eucalypticola]|uniref:AAA family ATPase n=1 Tax=Pseudomonas eucalypticola TaxID=2599595 RepID=A0A7D5HFQ5_9PSED|nr:AAA family ATPase [Pseudomonas eucalypticola]QKZ06430.1 AAA family ATPase [Pseudomonas eucalypticola]